MQRPFLRSGVRSRCAERPDAHQHDEIRDRERLLCCPCVALRRRLRRVRDRADDGDLALRMGVSQELQRRLERPLGRFPVVPDEDHAVVAALDLHAALGRLEQRQRVQRVGKRHPGPQRHPQGGQHRKGEVLAVQAREDLMLGVLEAYAQGQRLRPTRARLEQPDRRAFGPSYPDDPPGMACPDRADQRVVDIQDCDAVFRQGGDQLRFLRRDRLGAAVGAVVLARNQGQHADVWAENAQGSVQVARLGGSRFHDAELVPARGLEDGPLDVVVLVARSMAPLARPSRRQDARGERLGGGLSGAAGDADEDDAAQATPVQAGRVVPAAVVNSLPHGSPEVGKSRTQALNGVVHRQPLASFDIDAT